MIKHRTYKDNEFAAQGSRSTISVYEEIGMFSNLIRTVNANVETQRDSTSKFGTSIFIGTGGDFEGGGTRDAHEMFYHPDKFDLLMFEDEWESRGKIAYFIPAYRGLNQFKDKNGKSNEDGALKYLLDYRGKLQEDQGSKSVYANELQYRPIKPSESFLSKTGNILPVVEAKNRKSILLENLGEDYSLLSKKVHLSFNSKALYGVDYEIDGANQLAPIDKFPWKETNKEGAVVIYEFPLTKKDGTVPDGLYIIGHDPVASDSETGQSLSVTIVGKTKKY